MARRAAEIPYDQLVDSKCDLSALIEEVRSVYACQACIGVASLSGHATMDAWTAPLLGTSPPPRRDTSHAIVLSMRHVAILSDPNEIMTVTYNICLPARRALGQMAWAS